MNGTIVGYYIKRLTGYLADKTEMVKTVRGNTRRPVGNNNAAAATPII